jgi:hypothetical protein
MFVIPAPSKEQGPRTSQKSSSCEDSLELEIDLPAPSNKERARSTKGQRSAVSEPIAAIPRGSQFHLQRNATPKFESPYYSNVKAKSSISRALLVTLFILGSVMLAGGTIAAAVVVTKSFMASMPGAIAVPELGIDVSEAEASDASPAPLIP